MKKFELFSVLVVGAVLAAGARGVAISNATCEAFASGSIATNSGSVNATLHWQHDCGNASTTFTLVGEAPEQRHRQRRAGSAWASLSADKLNVELRTWRTRTSICSRRTTTCT
jgi:hypothetical protein